MRDEIESFRVAVDLDGVIAEDISPRKDFENCTSSRVAKDFTWKLHHLGCTVVIWTARPNEYLEVTIEWLRKHHIYFDSLIMDKMPHEIYFADNAHNCRIEVPLNFAGALRELQENRRYKQWKMESQFISLPEKDTVA